MKQSFPDHKPRASVVRARSSPPRLRRTGLLLEELLRIAGKAQEFDEQALRDGARDLGLVLGDVIPRLLHQRIAGQNLLRDAVDEDADHVPRYDALRVSTRGPVDLLHLRVHLLDAAGRPVQERHAL